MSETIYPKEPIVVVTIPKQGYNSMSVINETATDFKVQLYNPNVEPEAKDSDEEKHED